MNKDRPMNRRSSVNPSRNGATAVERSAFSVEVFARRTEISRSQVYVEIREGRLIAKKVGRLTRITADAEKKWQDALMAVVPRAAAAAVKRQQRKTRATAR
jgi:hypothetical protein